MKIIIDGPDNAGKTTWAKRFASQYELEYNHLTAQDPRGVLQYYDKFKQDNQVWDRHFISEYVYSKVFNRETEIDYAFLEIMIKHARINNVFLVIILAKQYDVSKESVAIQDHQLEIHNLFYRVAINNDIPIIWREI